MISEAADGRAVARGQRRAFALDRRSRQGRNGAATIRRYCFRIGKSNVFHVDRDARGRRAAQQGRVLLQQGDFVAATQLYEEESAGERQGENHQRSAHQTDVRLRIVYEKRVGRDIGIYFVRGFVAAGVWSLFVETRVHRLVRGVARQDHYSNFRSRLRRYISS